MSDEERDPDRERGFVVIDRRGRSEEEPETSASETRSAPEPDAPSPVSKEGAGPARPHALPPIDFASFVHSIAVSALYHLGLVAERETGKPPAPNFALARENIDILEMLQSKTQGNLDPEEARLIESLLYDLRMRFVEAKRSADG